MLMFFALRCLHLHSVPPVFFLSLPIHFASLPPSSPVFAGPNPGANLSEMQIRTSRNIYKMQRVLFSGGIIRGGGARGRVWRKYRARSRRYITDVLTPDRRDARCARSSVLGSPLCSVHVIPFGTGFAKFIWRRQT